MSPAPLKTERVVKKFGGVVALNGVSIAVPPNSITMMIGPNGSGKTTLINVISGFYKPDGGKVYFNGSDITGLPPHQVFRKGVVRTFQIPLPFQQLTVLENMLVAARHNPGESPISALLRRREWVKREEELAEKAMRILELLSLDHLWNRPASQLSGGQMKLLEIGRALMSDPKVVLMDEPVAGVNPKLAHLIMEHMLSLRDELSLSFLIVEHRLDIVLSYVDLVYALHQGRVIASGKPDDVVSHPAVTEAYLGG